MNLVFISSSLIKFKDSQILESISVSLQSFGLKYPKPRSVRAVIKVTFLYPNNDGSRFDMEYYESKHLQLSRDKFGDALRGLAVDKGTAGIEPGSKPPFHAVAQ